MRKILLISVLLLPVSVWATACPSGYLYWREVQLQKASGSTLTNYLYRGTLFYNAIKSSGGQIQHTATNPNGLTGQPADMVFCDANNSGNQIGYYMKYYDNVNGIARIDVLVPSLSNSSNTSIWIGLNNSSVSTTQQDTTIYATAGVKADYGLDDNAASTTVLDSVGSSNGTAAGNTSSNTITGPSIRAQATAAMPISVSATSQLISGTGARTLYCWGRTSTNTHDEFFCGYGPGGSTGNAFSLFVSAGSHTLQFAGYAADVNSGVDISSVNQVWHYLVVTYDNAASPKLRIYIDGAQVATGNPTLNTTASNWLLGKPQWSSACTNCNVDEAGLVSGAMSADWVATSYQTQKGLFYPFNSSFKVIDTTYAAPAVVQYATCASPNSATTAPSCTFPFPLTSGGYVAYSSAVTGTDCGTVPPSDGLGLTLTQQARADATGTLQHYYNCQYTAPITSTGSDTVTGGTINSALAIAEIKAVTTSGIVTASDGSNTPPSLTATCSGGPCLLICGENLTNSSAGQLDTYGNSNGYPSIVSNYSFPVTADHVAQAYLAYANVASGSNSCGISGSGQAGTELLLPVSASITSKPRPAQVY